MSYHLKNESSFSELLVEGIKIKKSIKEIDSFVLCGVESASENDAMQEKVSIAMNMLWGRWFAEQIPQILFENNLAVSSDVYSYYRNYSQRNFQDFNSYLNGETKFDIGLALQIKSLNMSDKLNENLSSFKVEAQKYLSFEITTNRESFLNDLKTLWDKVIWTEEILKMRSFSQDFSIFRMDTEVWAIETLIAIK